MSKHITGYDIREPDSVVFTIATSGATVAVQMQFKDYAGNNMATKSVVRMYYTSDADGDTVVAMDNVSATATNGIIIEDLTLYTATGITEDAGTLGLTLNDAATLYLNIIFPDGHIQTSEAVECNA